MHPPAAFADRLGEQEFTTDIALSAPVERRIAVRLAFLPHYPAAGEQTRQRDAQEQQHVNLPGEVYEQRQGADDQRGNAEPQEEGAGREDFQAEHQQPGDMPAPWPKRVD